MAKPEKLRIPLDEYHFENVGRLPDGTQFMAYVTGAFPTGQSYYSGDDWQSKKKWLGVIHRFDADGRYIATGYELGGFEIEDREVAGAKAFALLGEMFSDMLSGVEPEFCDIWVAPFSVEIDDVTYGLIYEQSDEEPEEGEERSDWVMLEPRDIMFHPPWDSGEYST
ncbi:hypothetical protein ACYOEI_03160 [Singulisphaera rosea]